ncbi:MAG: formimidoylglutamase [Asgard group archaeon]|nr:formimidoylglutamase [Asgard group archaeon]
MPSKKREQSTKKTVSKISPIAECLRKWESYHEKGFDPNETRILDIFECWAGEEGPAIGLIGVPFDSAVLGRKGAKGGPRKIRDSFRYFKAYDWRSDFWFGDKKVYDFGDIIAEEQSVRQAHETISDIICKIARKGFTPITLGGDHSLGYPLLEGVTRNFPNKKFGLVNIDAHLDVREVINGRISSGTPFRRVLDNGLVDGDNFVEIGIRNFANAKKYREYAEEQGVTIFTVDDIKQQGFSKILQKTIKIITKRTDLTYLSVDMDALDINYAPGVSAPTPNGLSPREISEIIDTITAKTPIAGMDIVELNPVYDTADTTAINAASFVVQFIASFYRKNL